MMLEIYLQSIWFWTMILVSSLIAILVTVEWN